MARVIPRALAGALVGTLLGAACLIGAFAIHPDLTFEMDRDLPRLAAGFYPAERSGDKTYMWTSGRARLTLPGADRRSPWLCVVRFRGGRADGAAQPTVDLVADGAPLASKTATNDYQDLEATVPARPDSPGLTLAIVSSKTFVPGPADARELGVQVDRLSCRPVGDGLALPPRRALVGASLAAAALGAGAALAGLGLWSTACATLLIAAGQSVPLATGAGPYGPYADQVVWIATWIAVAMVCAVKLIERWNRSPLQPAATFVMMFSAGTLHLKLLALLHPAKLVIDAIFHAHRFEWVLSGRWYFTQTMPDGVQFPYAIGLYLFAIPWAGLARDHVALLRIVVCASEIAAGAVLYPMVTRTWGDRIAGAVAVVLFSCVPISYWVQGNANLTNAFGQSAALVAMSAATLWPLAPRRYGQVIGLAAIVALALLSHVSTFGLLLGTLAALMLLYATVGGSATRPQARSVLVATGVALVFSVAVYYGHFGDTYRSLQRVRVSAVADGATTETPDAAAVAGDLTPAPRPGHSVGRRAADALSLSRDAVGWPILVLATAGAWRLWASGRRDRLALAIGAWAAAYAVFLAFAVLAPVRPGFERYATEFVARVTYATYPAVVLLAANGGVWAWRAGLLTRLFGAALLGYALVIGVRSWSVWLS